tara:strand:- start:5529 stop:6218 length:690 start_codon:yes stop_codon:yes gene_type:complete
MDTSKIKIVFLTNKSDFGRRGYEIFLNEGFDIVFASFGENNLFEILKKNKFDYLISFCYPYRVSKDILKLANKTNINFHPAPLPYYRGFAVYNFGIMNEESEWGTTAHIMEEKFDTGDIVFSNTFKICKETETAFSLRDKSREKLFDLLKEYVVALKKDIPIKKMKQVGESKYFSKKMLNKERIIQEKDSHKVIDKKIRAFWCPPYPGAAFNINGKQYIIINEQILKQG